MEFAERRRIVIDDRVRVRVEDLSNTLIEMADRVLLPADLFESAERVFQDKKFDAVRTHVGIVATRWKFETPMIFKTAVDQAHGDRGNFIPGFGCTVGDAVQASCSAYPSFCRKKIVTSDGKRILLRDGGYSANNPILYAAGHHL